MYGMINRFKAHPGKRDAAIEPMLQDTVPVEGCLSFVVALDPTDPDGLFKGNAGVKAKESAKRHSRLALFRRVWSWRTT